MRWAENVARMGEMRNVYTILFESLKGRDYLEDLGLDDRLTLKWILGK
jgi:hypothetical protein